MDRETTSMAATNIKLVVFLVLTLVNQSRSDENVSAIIKYYTELCGPAGVCKPEPYVEQKFLKLDFGVDSPCPACYCDEWCHVLKDCCIDIQLAETLSHVTTNYSHVISTMYCSSGILVGPTPNNMRVEYVVINSCPGHYDNHLVTSSCQNTIDYHNISTFGIVTSSTSKLSYKNIFCAICNGDTDIKTWDLFIPECQLDNFTDFSRAESTRFLLKMAIASSCSIGMKPDSSLMPRRCPKKHRRVTCTNDLPGTFDFDLEWACDNTELAHLVNSLTSYKNLFCFLCERPLTAEETSCNISMDSPKNTLLKKGCDQGRQLYQTLYPEKNFYCYACNEIKQGKTVAKNDLQINVQFGYLFDISWLRDLVVGADSADESNVKCKWDMVFDPYKVCYIVLVVHVRFYNVFKLAIFEIYIHHPRIQTVYYIHRR